MSWLNSADRKAAARHTAPIRVQKDVDGWAVYRLPFRAAVLEDFPTALAVAIGMGNRMRAAAKRDAFLYSQAPVR